MTRRRFLGGLWLAGLGAGAAGVTHVWQKKDMTARLFNPFSIGNFELPPIAGLIDAEGKPVPGFSSADLAGRRSLLNIWASWCPTCRQEHALLMALAKRRLAPIYGADVKDDPEHAKSFLAKHGNPYVAIGADDRSFLQRAFGARGVPATFVVGPGPVITLSIFEPLNENIIEERIVPALMRGANAAVIPGRPKT